MCRLHFAVTTVWGPVIVNFNNYNGQFNQLYKRPNLLLFPGSQDLVIVILKKDKTNEFVQLEYFSWFLLQIILSKKLSL